MISSSNLKTNANHEMLEMFGDVVVGNYTDDGRSIKASKYAGDQDENIRKQQCIMEHAARAGGSLLPTQSKPKTKRGTKGKKHVYDVPTLPPHSIIQPQLPTEQEQEEPVKVKAVKKKTIYLHNQMGKIKMQVEDVLDSEMAYCLVFSTEDDVIFTPNRGETLNFTNPDGDTSPVYFADTLFNWTDGIKQLMILFKADN